MSEGADEWSCYIPGPESGMGVYVHLIRSPDDPERTPRPKGGHADCAPHLTANRGRVDDHAARILDHLSDGVPRTFNRICVELYDKTADVLFSTRVDCALWGLVATGRVEHTNRAPVLFRRKDTP